MSGPELTVTLSGGSADDAQKVVRALEPAFGPADDLPADDHASVHTATFADGTADRPAGTEQGHLGHLSAPVTVTVQGTPNAVEAASDMLSRAFPLHDQGSASGDQEQERQLLLAP
ncbi:hypothetical protein CLM62_47985 [Streptomyces sp. SA15]|uniref:hypothetical protein n=1 Tax=Streptomyces sp. SA15 TaxID=934019 RepID=UPI000BAF014E|nr:hypothetical protein [Streptomyces sp. SA15]PAZ09101.1 hypothetical protein CLM62_47985 [Streptomyces sp. SA15]